MATEDRLTALEDSLQDVIEAVRVMNEHRRRLEQSFQLLVEHRAETDEAVNRMLRHLLMRSDDGDHQ
jgi:hypothetical protein